MLSTAEYIILSVGSEQAFVSSSIVLIALVLKHRLTSTLESRLVKVSALGHIQMQHVSVVLALLVQISWLLGGVEGVD